MYKFCNNQIQLKFQELTRGEKNRTLLLEEAREVLGMGRGNYASQTIITVQALGSLTRND